MDYRYERFDRELLDEDSSFRGGPSPGDPFPDFELPTTDGGIVRKADFAGAPWLVVLSSFT